MYVCMCVMEYEELGVWGRRGGKRGWGRWIRGLCGRVEDDMMG